MEEQCYWIIKFPFSGFWGTAFKFWSMAKLIFESVLNVVNIFVSQISNENGRGRPE